MRVIYNSEDYCVVEFLAPSKAPGNMEGVLWKSEGYEIVAKHLQRELFIHGPMAEEFRKNVQKLMAREEDDEVDEEEVDAFLGGFDSWMQQPVVLH